MLVKEKTKTQQPKIVPLEIKEQKSDIRKTKRIQGPVEQLLRKAKKVISKEKNWTQSTLIEKFAFREAYCAVGALNVAADKPHLNTNGASTSYPNIRGRSPRDIAYKYLNQAAEEIARSLESKNYSDHELNDLFDILDGYAIYDLNDDYDHKTIMKAFNKAIRKAAKEGK